MKIYAFETSFFLCQTPHLTHYKNSIICTAQTQFSVTSFCLHLFVFPLALPARHKAEPSRMWQRSACVERCVWVSVWTCVCVCVRTSSQEQSCCCMKTLWQNVRQQTNQTEKRTPLHNSQVTAEIILQLTAEGCRYVDIKGTFIRFVVILKTKE